MTRSSAETDGPLERKHDRPNPFSASAVRIREPAYTQLKPMDRTLYGDVKIRACAGVASVVGAPDADRDVDEVIKTNDSR